MGSINWRAICYINGFLLFALAFIMLIPPLFDVWFFKQDQTHGFYIGFCLCFVVGSSLILANRSNEKMVLEQREAFLITTFVWIILSLFSSIPLYVNIPEISFVDACFESVSSLTTTGATILKKIEQLPMSILLWRSILQWLGGIGIIVIAMSFFPALRLGGMQLFRSEFSDRYEKILPKISQIAASLLICYIFFTFICGVLYYSFGMSFFDALCHAMGTISTGGASNYSDSVLHFNSFTLELICCFFMIIGGTTLMLFIRMFYDDWRIIKREEQFFLYLKMLLFFSIIVVFWFFFCEKLTFLNALRTGIFNVISCLTTSGYTNTSFTWTPFPFAIFFFLSCIGGCTGSTTGGIKIFRLQVLMTFAATHMRQLRRPNSVLVPKFQGHKITDAVAFSVFTLITLYILMIVVLTVLLSACGLDFFAAIASAGSVLGNVGTGLGSLADRGVGITPLSYMMSKYILMLGMICGRLELLTFLILFMPSFWKD
ncbi:MAG: TrkH family potassium uptake protein [Proteobacteria bacterium]|nr:TrkH family potassium uptake protein [Pseudomonadota bacterium]